VVVEGLSSIGQAMRRVMAAGPLSEASLYDESIGWVGKPNTWLPDHYGKGKSVRINVQGFRDDIATELSVTNSKLRIVCSGDSFTFGQGVANADAWCPLLEKIDSRVDSVNMGQPGYGVDQMYLLYMRDGLRLEHSIHLFAFIGADLSRMDNRDQHGYGKPTLALAAGNLKPDNVPVPNFSWWLSRKVVVMDLSLFGLSQGLMGRFLSPAGEGLSRVERIGPVARAVFEDLLTVGQENGIVTVFIFLPGEGDVREDKSWRTWTAKTMAELNANYIDLTEDLRQRPAAEFASYFIDKRKPGGGHYTEAGNRWVAELLYGRLKEIASIADLLPGPGQGEAEEP